MAIPEIKKIIRSINFKDAKKRAEEVLKLTTIDEIKRFLIEEYAKKFGKENKG
jgi:phosphoenolpyruvate-protein kinase (PTS system EI component)